MRQANLPLSAKKPLPSVTLLHGDCLELMPTLPEKSVQMIFADLPYGKVTKCYWDVAIHLGLFWVAALRACDGNLIFTATFPFTLDLIASNRKDFAYDLIWHKKRVTGFFNARRAPLRSHESVLVFKKGGALYNSQMINGKRFCVTSKPGLSDVFGASLDRRGHAHNGSRRHPGSVLQFEEHDLRCDTLNGNLNRRIHPTQKPVALLEWLIRTYTNEGDTVLDPTAGSGTTAIAAMRTGRHSICIEKDGHYFAVMQKRVADERARLENA